MNYLRDAAQAVATPPQSEPLDIRQVENSAGGFVYAVDDWKRLDRFLILGSEGGSYYASEKKLSVENIKAVAACVKDDGERTVRRIVEISDSGRAPKNDPALLALALAASSENKNTRTAALDALPKVARIGTHLFHFVDYVQQFRGWGRGLRSAIGDWYARQDPDKLADQVTKYQQRDKWSHRDLLRLAHPKLTGVHQNIARWVVKGLADDVPLRIHGHVQLQAETDPKKAAKLIREYGLVRESVPTELLKEPAVWYALLEKMPLTALIRNLGNMSKIGLLKPLSDASRVVVDKLGDQYALKKSRIHPMGVLIAEKTYASGHGLLGKGTWTPVSQVVDALDEAFYASFQFIEPTGKRFYLGLDISGSMWTGVVAGVNGLTPAVASGVMASATVKSEKQCYAAGFTTAGTGFGGRWDHTGVEMTPVALSPKQRLDDVEKTMQALSSRMGGTDCSLPMIDALQKKLDVDTFVIYTDNETWAGNIHPPQALHNYRQKTGIPARLVVVGMVSNGFTIADPMDAGMLDVVGFDSATPAIISDFSR